MNRIGEVWQIGAGVVVVRSPDESFPDVGVDVVTEALDTVGRVVDVMGPVDRPYVVISPTTREHDASILGELLYAR